ncbi:MAG TPA: hypothetical protein VK116_12630, partial [Planctomycetota bacterium]|nr:hypothetical protein [Planctomycetota bacterium]
YAANEDTGTIVRMEDLDGDGNAEGPNEAVLVLDDSVRTRPRSPRDMLFLEDGALYVIDANADTIFRLEDVDGDGIYASDGEVEAIVVTDGVFSTPGCLAWVAKEGTDPGPGPEPALFVRGDANSDDSINLADSLTVLNFLYLGGSTLDCEDAADVDDDGGLNLSDPIYLLNYLFLGGNAPLPPFETRGADPTEDGLGCGDET